MPTAASTDFVPADLDASRWDALEPLYRELLGRTLSCERCLESLILDRSELDAAAAEAHANLYIARTCNTEDEAAKIAWTDPNRSSSRPACTGPRPGVKDRRNQSSL